MLICGGASPPRPAEDRSGLRRGGRRAWGRSQSHTVCRFGLQTTDISILISKKVSAYRAAMPKYWLFKVASVLVVAIAATAIHALPPEQYPTPIEEPGSGGGGGSCTNDTTPAGCSHTYKQSSSLQVWCGESRQWVYIKSESCFYDSRRKSGCCTYQRTVCTYQNNSGVSQEQQETLANQEACEL